MGKRGGVFVSFEGIEGSGKTTQAKLLAQQLRDLGYEVLLSREPGGTLLGEQLRNLLQGMPLEITPLAELLLYAADRAQHVREVIAPALAVGKVVICDRYSDATIAYQGYGRGLKIDMIQKINGWVTKDITPQITFLLDVTPEVGLERVLNSKGTLDRLEKEDKAFHQRTREGYLKLARQHEQRFKVIAGDGDISLINKKIIQQIKPLLSF
jgi:dTMP kinase